MEENENPTSLTGQAFDANEYRELVQNQQDTDPEFNQRAAAAVSASTEEIQKLQGEQSWSFGSFAAGIKDKAVDFYRKREKMGAWGRVKDDVNTAIDLGKAAITGPVKAVTEGLEVVGEGAAALTYGTAKALNAVGLQHPDDMARYAKNYDFIMSQAGHDDNIYIRAQKTINGWVGPPQTAIGGLAEGVAQGVTGAVITYVALRGAGAPAVIGNGASKVVSLVSAMGTGAIADAAFFNPYEERVANLLMKGPPSIRNPVFDFLQAKPGDRAAEGRLKNALEGMAMGAAVDTTLAILKGVRASKFLKKGDKAAHDIDLKEANEGLQHAAEGQQPVVVQDLGDGKWTLAENQALQSTEPNASVAPGQVAGEPNVSVAPGEVAGGQSVEVPASSPAASMPPAAAVSEATVSSGSISAPRNEAAHTAKNVVKQPAQAPVFHSKAEAEAAADSINRSAADEVRPTILDEKSTELFREAWRHYNETGDIRSAVDILEASNFNPNFMGGGSENTLKALMDAAGDSTQIARGSIPYGPGKMPVTLEEIAEQSKDIFTDMETPQILDFMKRRYESSEAAARELTAMRFMTQLQTNKVEKLLSKLELNPKDTQAFMDLSRAADTLIEMHTFTSGTLSSEARALSSARINVKDAAGAELADVARRNADEVVNAAGGKQTVDEMVALAHGPADLPAEVVNSSHAPQWVKDYDAAAKDVEKATKAGPQLVEGPVPPAKMGPAEPPKPKQKLAWKQLEEDHARAAKQAEADAKRMEKGVKEIAALSNEELRLRFSKPKGTDGDFVLQQYLKMQRDAEAATKVPTMQMGPDVPKVDGPKPPPAFGPKEVRSWAEAEAGDARALADAQKKAQKAAKTAAKEQEKAAKKLEKDYSRLNAAPEGPKVPPKEGAKVEGPAHERSPAARDRAWAEQDRQARKAELQQKMDAARTEREVARQQAKLDPRVEGPVKAPKQPGDLKVEGPAHVDSERINGKGDNFRLPNTFKSTAYMSADELMSFTRMAFLATGESPAAVMKIMRGPKIAAARAVTDHALKSKWKSYVFLYRINAMLSALTTQATAATMNGAASVMEPTVRILAGFGSKNAKLKQQGFDILAALATKDWSESWRMAKMSFKTGDSVIDRRLGSSIETGLGDYSNDNWLVKAVKMPVRLLMSQEEFVKVKNYRANMRSQILAKARAEGITDPTELAKRVNDDMKFAFDPDGGAVNPAALEYSRQQTFTSDLKIPDGKGPTYGEDIHKFVQNHDAARILVPFVKQPINAFRYSWKQAPILSSFNREVRLALKEGGERAAIARAHQAMGMAMWGSAAMLMASGSLTGRGPSDPAMRKQWLERNQPYSVKLPGTDVWISYRRGDPFTTSLGLIADAATLMSQMDEDMDADEVAAVALASITSNLSSKVFMQGMVETMDSLTNGDAQSFQRTMGVLAGTLVPNLVKTTSLDNTIYESQSFLDTMFARTPGYKTVKEGLGGAFVAPRRNALGEKAMGRVDVWQRVWNPYPAHVAGDWDVLDEMNELGKALPMPMPILSGGLVDLRDGVAFDDRGGQPPYDRLMELMEKPVDGGQSARQALEALVKSDEWREAGSKSERYMLAAANLKEVESRALEQLYTEYPSLESAQEEAAEAQEANLTHGQDGVEAVADRYEKLFGKSRIKRKGLMENVVPGQAERPE